MNIFLGKKVLEAGGRETMETMAKVSTVCDEEYKRKVKDFAKARGLFMGEWVRRVLDDAMEGRPQLEERVPPNLRPYLVDVADILSSGDKEAVEALTSNLRAFSSLVKLRESVKP